MRLSAFTIVDAHPESERHRDRFAEVLELAEVCDTAGLSTLWVAEHHFHPGGVCPSPPVLLAAAGARTRRLRLGVLVSVLPFHSPIELAEQYALLDRLVGGRLEVGVGSGYIPLEFEGFGIAPESKRELFDRNLERLLAGLRGEPIAHGSSGEIRLNVRPVQVPHPPIRVAVQRREALPHLARRSLSIALIPYATVPDLAALAEEIGEYRAALPPGVTAEVSVALHLYAGAAVAEARAALQRYLDARLATQSTNYQARVHADPHVATAAGVEATGFALLGSAATVRERLREFERAGVDEVLGIFDFGALAAGLVHRSVAALAAEWGA
ncbi:MAG TPA: LLM class flavin-dependent oxidoreductase [Thermoplasmata archaeon]|nr:LLM class flavin-dependent oxidoreductase [Thermoplasmata archaeon]